MDRIGGHETKLSCSSDLDWATAGTCLFCMLGIELDLVDHWEWDNGIHDLYALMAALFS